MISAARSRGDITIEPFDSERVQPNSYDFRLGSHLRICTGELDAAQPTSFHEVVIPAGGYVLEPDSFYLALTHELTGSRRYAQMLNGDRSLGSLGVWVHVSAPLGHAGHSIRWTLEIRAVRRVRVYPLMCFGKIVFLDMLGAPSSYLDATPPAKYRSDTIEISRLYEEVAPSP